MRKLDYWRHEFHSSEPEPRKAELPFFLLDIPYLFFEGIIPPLSVVNSVLRTGGGDAGMSPGTSWEPFVVTDREYAQLVQRLAALDVAEATKKAHTLRPSDPERCLASLVVVCDDALAQNACITCLSD
jgi:hypothetical protein